LRRELKQRVTDPEPTLAELRTRAPALAAENIVKQYPGVKAVDHVSLSVDEGELVGLVGHNGAGKSTLTRILAGLERPDSGTLTAAGEELELHGTTEALRRGIVLVPQQLLVVPELTVAQNVTLGMHRRDARARMRARSPRGGGSEQATVKGLLDELGVRTPLKTPAGRLGPASQRLVMIARGIARNPRLLILDEATSNLSEPDVARLFALVRGLAADGVGVLYITHRLHEIHTLTRRVVVMRDGRVVASAPTTISRGDLRTLVAGHAESGEKRQRRPDMRIGAPALECVRLTSEPRTSDVSFALHAGEVLGLTGLVGSGRSALLRAICGMTRLDAGEMFIDGHPFRPRSVRDAIRSGIAYLPEDRAANALFTDLDVASNVTLPSLSRFRQGRTPLISRRREIKKATELLARLDTRPVDAARRVISDLSGGNQQKAVLARWILRGARIFMFDEPTEGVDIGAREQIYALFAELARTGQGIIVCSSDIEEIVSVSDRVLVMRRGRLVAQLAGADISEGAIKHASLE
jgi:ribose transport system ATP-binding protein